MIWKAMFPLNEVPPTLLTLISKFSNARKIQSHVRAQLIAGAETAFALVLSKHPSANLMAIANADGNVGHLFAREKIPAAITIERLEDSSKVDDEAKNSEPDNIYILVRVMILMHSIFIATDCSGALCVGCKFRWRYHISVFGKTQLSLDIFFRCR
jgi:hypothetical protein